MEVLLRKIFIIALGLAALILAAGYGLGWVLDQDSPYKRLTSIEIQQTLAKAEPLDATASPKSQEKQPESKLLPDRILGDPKAPITIIEYASLTCPHCAHFHKDTLPKIKSEFIDKGLVKLIMRPFPFDAVALEGSLMAYCLPAAQYYPFLDAAFASQNDWARAADPIAELKKMARLAGLNDDKLTACKDAKSGLNEGLLRGRVKAEKELGVQSTPTFLIGEEKIDGARDFEVFKNAINAALKSVQNGKSQ